MNNKKIDNEVLIQAIRAQPQLWDIRVKSYNNKAEKQLAWQEVADDVGSSVKDCRARWKTLRDSFLRQLRNLRKKGISDESLSSQWAHFDDMLFLKDVITLKSLVFEMDDFDPTESKMHIAKVKSERAYNDDDTFDESEDVEEPSIKTKRIKITPPKVEQSHQDPLRISIRELEKKKIEILQRDSTMDSPDYHFLMSLLPTLEKLPKEKKMLMKVQMLSMLYEATFGEPVPSNSLNRSFKAVTSSRHSETVTQDFDDSIST